MSSDFLTGSNGQWVLIKGNFVPNCCCTGSTFVSGCNLCVTPSGCSECFGTSIQNGFAATISGQCCGSIVRILATGHRTAFNSNVGTYEDYLTYFDRTYNVSTHTGIFYGNGEGEFANLQNAACSSCIPFCTGFPYLKYQNNLTGQTFYSASGCFRTAGVGPSGYSTDPITSFAMNQGINIGGSSEYALMADGVCGASFASIDRILRVGRQVGTLHPEWNAPNYLFYFFDNNTLGCGALNGILTNARPSPQPPRGCTRYDTTLSNSIDCGPNGIYPDRLVWSWNIVQNASGGTYYENRYTDFDPTNPGTQFVGYIVQMDWVMISVTGV